MAFGRDMIALGFKPQLGEVAGEEEGTRESNTHTNAVTWHGVMTSEQAQLQGFSKRRQ